MVYAAFGHLRALALRLQRDERGQGTVEYVGLILLVALLIGGVVAATRAFEGDTSIATKLVGVLEDGIDDVVGKKGR